MDDQDTANILARQRDEQGFKIHRLEEENKQLRKALRPFATFADHTDRKLPGGLDDELYIMNMRSIKGPVSFKFSDCVKAAELLELIQDRALPDFSIELTCVALVNALQKLTYWKDGDLYTKIIDDTLVTDMLGKRVVDMMKARML